MPDSTMKRTLWIPLLLLCGVVGAVEGLELNFEDDTASAVQRNAQASVDGFVDTEACYSAMESSVATSVAETGDRSMDSTSYVTFVQEYGPSGFLANVTEFADLPLILQSNFNVLACLCQTDASDACCVGDQAAIQTDGSFSGETPTPEEQAYLFLVCSLTSLTIDRVLQSAAPTSTPTITPRPVGESSSAPSGAPSEAETTEETVLASYGVAITNGTATLAEYSPFLIAAMDSLAPEVLQSIQRRQLRHGRRLQSVQLPTSIADSQVIECPSTVSSADRCDEITASIVLLFQPTEQDPSEVAATFQVDLENAISIGELQAFLTTDIVYILDSSTDGTNGGTGSTSSDGISAGGIAGAVVGSLVVVALAAILVKRRGGEAKDELQELPPNPKLALEEGTGEPSGEKEPVKVEKMAAVPMDDPTKVVEVVSSDKQMLLPDDMIHMDDDASSNAGDSGWSSSAGISSLNTGSVDGLEGEKSVGGIGTTLAALNERAGYADGPDISDSDSPSIPSVSRTDLDNAIEAGDWAAVGATAALLAAASDSQSYSSKSEQLAGTQSQGGESSVSSLDAARAAELDHLVDAGDWEGVVLAAAKYEADEGKDSLPSESVSGSESRSNTDTAGQTADSSVASSKAMKRQEYRAIVEDLVQRVVPEELQNVDEMMLQFRGREDELVETLRTMQERAIAQKARHTSQRAAKVQAKMSSKAAKEEQGAVAVKSIGTGSITAQASAKSLGTGKVESTTKGRSLGTGTIQDSKTPAKHEKKQSALEAAIEAGDWDAVGEAAAILTDNSMASSADSEEINRLAEGVSTDGSSVAGSGGQSEAAEELEELIEAGDWTGVVQAASGKTTGSSTEKQKELEDARRQRRLKHLQEEQEALEQAEIWAAIAEQSKQDVQGTAQSQAAAEATDWAISRSLNALVEAEQSGLNDESTGGGSEVPRGKDNDDEDSDMEV